MYFRGVLAGCCNTGFSGLQEVSVGPFLLDRPRTVAMQKRDFQAVLKQQKLTTLQIMN